MSKLGEYLRPQYADDNIPDFRPVNKPAGKAALAKISERLAGKRGRALVAGSFHCVGECEPLDWAYRLRDREQAGECLNMAQSQAWRQALGVGKEAA